MAATLEATQIVAEAPAVKMSPGEALSAEMSECADDPERFVDIAYPWREPGELVNEDGPDANQREFLCSLGEEVRRREFDGITPVMPVLMAERSGHGTGKTAMGAWLADWILSTRPNSCGTVTAGTYQQLESRTWAAIKRWTKMCITAPWFDIRASGIYEKGSPEDWKLVLQTCKAENAHAFAGQHARTSTSWYLFDEASEIPDEIWDEASGGLTDGEPMMFAWGQMVRNSGRFYQVCFGSEAHKWNTRGVDSRTSKFTNKKLIDEWIRDYGIDSDYVRVRVLGLPPTADELQYIDRQRVLEAQAREVQILPDEPLIVGLDVSGGGAAWNVFYPRRGMDARSIPRIRISGQAGRDRSVLIAKASEILRDGLHGNKVAAMFVDTAFGAPIVERLHTLGFHNAIEVNFGGGSPDSTKLNMRAYMWASMKDWLPRGAIATDEDLSLQLSRPGYHLNTSNKLVIEPKEHMIARGEASPDDADALCLTFAQRVAPPRKQEPAPVYRNYGDLSGGGWMA